MGRSGVMGKPVEDLTYQELLSERERCQCFLSGSCHREARKFIEQRLRQIKKLLETQD